MVLTLCASAASAATFNVTRADDPAPNGCLAADCSLREAIEATVATPEADAIVLGAGQFQVTRGELAIGRAMTIAGAGSAATRITSSGDYPILHVLPFGALTIQGTEIGTVDGSAVVVEDNATATLRDIHVPANTGGVGTAPADTGTGSIRIENSTLDSFLACFQPQGSCRVFDSRLHELLITSELELVRVEVDGANTDTYGVTVMSDTPITIEDSTIRRTGRPLYLRGDGESAAPVHVRRTRFLDNTGPLIADRVSVIDMDEVEFRHHVVSGANAGAPAVLYALPGPLWSISRALVVGNRGGADLDGAVIRVVGGGRVAFDNSTFDDNTFRADVSYGHTIGVYNSTNTTALLWLFHVTMRRSALLDDTTVGSLLTVRGPMTNVSVDNSALLGTCAFGGGGAITQGVGNAEAPGDTCGLDPTTNQVEMAPPRMSLGDLDDHGGFTDTFYPTPISALIDAADEAFCAIFGPLDQRRYARPVDGIGCDVGAAEVDAVADLLFADGFGD
jgi:hypothetical protein